MRILLGAIVGSWAVCVKAQPPDPVLPEPSSDYSMLDAGFSDIDAPPAAVPPSFISDGDWHAELVRMQQEIDNLKAAQTLPPHDVGGVVVTPVCPPTPEKPKYPTVRLTGFFHADAVWFDQSPQNMVAVGDPAAVPAVSGDAQDGWDFRRARLAAVGQAWDNVAYQLEMDFGFPGRPSFMDVWLDIDDVIGTNNLRIGQFRQPIGMDAMTSVRELPFLERALPMAFVPFRQTGALLYGNQKDELATWAVSAFRYPTDFYGGNVGDNGGYGMATRLTGLIASGEQGVVHVGGAYAFIDPSNDLFQFRNQPEVFVGETGGGVPLGGVPATLPAFVDTGLISSENASLLGAELAASYQSFYVQSEVIHALVDQRNGPSLGFSGAYAHCGYFLTGERRPYLTKAGVFGTIVPNRSVGKDGGIGAWEIASRYSYLDLTDENIFGGRLSNITTGLNWYLNPYTKFQINYIYSMLDKPVGPGAGESDAGIYAVRAQLAF